MPHSRFLTVLGLLVLFCSAALASPMVRVIQIPDARTLVVDRNGVAVTITMAGLDYPPGDEPLAAEWLRRTLTGAWVMVETDARGSYVYRSPDARYINGELARRAYASQGPAMTWLGESWPAPARAVAPKKEKPAAAPPAPMPLPKPHRLRRTPRGAHRIPRL